MGVLRWQVLPTEGPTWRYQHSLCCVEHLHCIVCSIESWKCAIAKSQVAILQVLKHCSRDAFSLHTAESVIAAETVGASGLYKSSVTKADILKSTMLCCSPLAKTEIVIT